MPAARLRRVDVVHVQQRFFIVVIDDLAVIVGIQRRLKKLTAEILNPLLLGGQAVISCNGLAICRTNLDLQMLGNPGDFLGQMFRHVLVGRNQHVGERCPDFVVVEAGF